MVRVGTHPRGTASTRDHSEPGLGGAGAFGGPAGARRQAGLSEKLDTWTKQSLSGDMNFLQMGVLERKPASSKDTMIEAEKAIR